MVRKKYNPTIPSKRFFTNLFFLEKQSLQRSNLLTLRPNKVYNKTKQGAFVLRGLRKLRRMPSPGLCFNLLKNCQYIAVKTAYNNFYCKQYLTYINIFNQATTLPRLTSSFIGHLNYLNLREAFLTPKIFAPNLITQLSAIPYNLPLCFLKNLSNSKPTYALSTGSAAIKVKAKKRNKLTAVKLASEQLIYLLSLTECLIGTLLGESSSKISLGKFSSPLKKKLVTKVRGVAMNPVDHPNGGRTKSKSPELSPWGWIAKQTK